VRHDKADNPDVNRNASRSGSVAVSGESIGIGELYSSLLAIGLDSVTLQPLANVETVDTLLAAIEKVPPSDAELALGLIESEPFLYARTQYRVLNEDEGFLAALGQDAQTWALYLHRTKTSLCGSHSTGICWLKEGREPGKRSVPGIGPSTP
jgi:hypothetical protein